MVDQFDGNTIIKNEKGLKQDEVFNGIAYNRESNKYILTGKDWSHFYEAEFWVFRLYLNAVSAD